MLIRRELEEAAKVLGERIRTGSEDSEVHPLPPSSFREREETNWHSIVFSCMLRVPLLVTEQTTSIQALLAFATSL